MKSCNKRIISLLLTVIMLFSLLSQITVGAVEVQDNTENPDTAETVKEKTTATDDSGIPKSNIIGDLDGDGNVDKDDAIYLLMHVFFADEYPISQECDFDKNGKVDKDDAIYLLMHIFFQDEYPVYSQGLKYTLNSDGKSYSVSGIGTCKDTDIFIPDRYNGLPVTAVADRAFENCEQIVNIHLPQSVIVIGEGAFRGCINIKIIIILKYIQTIGNGAFEGCTGLTEVKIENGVQFIGKDTFK